MPDVTVKLTWHEDNETGDMNLKLGPLLVGQVMWFHAKSKLDVSCDPGGRRWMGRMCNLFSHKTSFHSSARNAMKELETAVIEWLHKED